MDQFDSIEALAAHLRQELATKKTLLLFAYNGTGKTRLSMAFRELGKLDRGRDTLYFNAFTEDLFSWDNDLEGDSERVLKLNADSRFFAGLDELEMDNRIRPILNRYADFDFRIDTDNWEVRFSREELTEDEPNTIDNIKVSRGEENLFIWCFFLAIVQLSMDKDIEAYSWVKYVYIDDPISSLDENNAIAVGHHLTQLLKEESNPLKTVISSHHTLFFNVMVNEFRNQLTGRNKSAEKYFLSKNNKTGKYFLKGTSDTPHFYHVAMLTLLKNASESGELYTYHFAILRGLLEKTASFLGYQNFTDCLVINEEDPDQRLKKRYIDILTHGGYSVFEPVEMMQENKKYFKTILDGFLNKYQFNTALFPELTHAEEEA